MRILVRAADILWWPSSLGALRNHCNIWHNILSYPNTMCTQNISFSAIWTRNSSFHTQTLFHKESVDALEWGGWVWIGVVLCELILPDGYYPLEWIGMVGGKGRYCHNTIWARGWYQKYHPASQGLGAKPEAHGLRCMSTCRNYHLTIRLYQN